jgi:hypothetical protein
MKDVHLVFKQEVLRRTNHPISFHCTLSIWCDTDHTENTASNKSWMQWDMTSESRNDWPEDSTVIRQWLYKHVPAETKKQSKKLGEYTRRQQADHVSLVSFFQAKENTLKTVVLLS